MSGVDDEQNDSVSLATQKEDASNAQYMLAPGQPFPSEAGVPSGDVNPGTNANATTSQSSSTQATTSSAAYASDTADASSQKLSTGAIVGIVIAGVAVAVLVGALFFLLGRQKTMLQFMRRNQYQAPGPQNPPEDQPDIRSPPPQMTSFSTASVIARSDTPNYHEPAYDTPPYTRHAAQDPLAAPQPLVAELPSPGQKHMQEYVSSKAPMETEQHVQEPYQDSRVPTPQPQARPLTFWGRSRSTRAQYVPDVLGEMHNSCLLLIEHLNCQRNRQLWGGAQIYPRAGTNLVDNRRPHGPMSYSWHRVSTAEFCGVGNRILESG